MWTHRGLASLFVAAIAAGCALGDGGTSERNVDCHACSNPDRPECTGCLAPGDPEEERGTAGKLSPYQDPSVVDQIDVTVDALDFAVVGDTRPATIDDTSNYPVDIITKIFDDIEAESPRPGFSIATGDYQFASTSGSESGPQLDLYLQARAHFSN